MKKFAVGKIVVVTGNSVSHSLEIGKTYKIHSIYTGQAQCWRMAQGGSYIHERDMRLAHTSRKEEADYLTDEVLPGMVSAAELATEAVEVMELKIKRLREFDSEEAEFAHVIAEVLKTGGDEAAITKVIKKANIFNNFK